MFYKCIEIQFLIPLPRLLYLIPPNSNGGCTCDHVGASNHGCARLLSREIHDRAVTSCCSLFRKINSSHHYRSLPNTKFHSIKFMHDHAQFFRMLARSENPGSGVASILHVAITGFFSAGYLLVCCFQDRDNLSQQYLPFYLLDTLKMNKVSGNKSQRLSTSMCFEKNAIKVCMVFLINTT